MGIADSLVYVVDLRWCVEDFVVFGIDDFFLFLFLLWLNLLSSW